MRLAQPFETVTPTVDGEVLLVLAAADRWFPLSRVHTLVGERSRSGVRKTLLRLVEQGIDVGVRVRRVAGVTTVEVGLGGPAAAYDPWELGVLPLSLADAGVLVAASSIGRALTDPMDRVPVIALVHRLAALVDEVDEVRSIHADPVVISGPNAWITDVEILLGEPGSDPLVRHLG